MKKVTRAIVLATTVFAFVGSAVGQTVTGESAPKSAEINPFRADAESLEELVVSVYAYEERFPDGLFVFSETLRQQAEAVADQRSLLGFTEKVLASLADHHAITGSSFSNSYAVIPSYSDLWIEAADDGLVITSVRADSPADKAGIRSGDLLVMLGNEPAFGAVSEYLAALGYSGSPEKYGNAARVLAAGRRDSSRKLTLKNASGKIYSVDLPSLYSLERASGLVSSSQEAGNMVIRFNDSLGDSDTIAAFDKEMAQAAPGQKIVLDLTNTASGGNTVIARAILGWFVTKPRFYQIHELPGEQRATGIARRWVEQVLPRAGKFHDGPVEVRVSRWTGSMGEGLAIGFDAIGACVYGTPMAGLLGAIDDHRLPNSGTVVKLPTERLLHVDGTPREDFIPQTDAAQCPR